jgi:hypothetical protein
MIMVQNLLAPPSSLLRPSMMLTVRRAARTALRQHAARTASTPLARQAVPASA